MEHPDPETPAATAEPRNAFLEEKAFSPERFCFRGDHRPVGQTSRAA